MLLQITYSPTIHYYYRLLAEVVTVAIVLVAIWSLYNHSKFKGVFKWLLYNICISALLEILGVIIVRMEIKNVHAINYFYQIQEAFTFGMFYYLLIQNQKIKSSLKYLFGVFVSLILFTAFYASKHESLLLFPSITAIFEAISFTFLSIFLHRQLNIKSKSLTNNPTFLFNIYILLSFIISFMFFVVINPLIKLSSDLAMIIYMIRNTTNLIIYSLWLIGIQKLRQSTKPTATPKPSQRPLGQN
jgi:hypothetical protein